VSLPTSFDRASMPFGAPPSGQATAYSTPTPQSQAPTVTQQGQGQPGMTPWGMAGQANYGPQFMAMGGTEYGPQFASVAGPQYPSFSSPAGFLPPAGGYGVPQTTIQQVGNPYTPYTQSGVTPVNPMLSSQAAGYTPLASQPNYGMQMGSTTGYKSTMK